jgi:hypothetical protein
MTISITDYNAACVSVSQTDRLYLHLGYAFSLVHRQGIYCHEGLELYYPKRSEGTIGPGGW